MTAHATPDVPCAIQGNFLKPMLCAVMLLAQGLRPSRLHTYGLMSATSEHACRPRLIRLILVGRAEHAALACPLLRSADKLRLHQLMMSLLAAGSQLIAASADGTAAVSAVCCR